MKLKFIKMHGCGNDYIYIDYMKKSLDLNLKDTAVKLSDRHFGIGGDGLVLIAPSNKADALMRMFNADGTEGKMCGNAIRCVAKYLYEDLEIKKTKMSIETLSGIKTLNLNVQNGFVKTVEVNMGFANFNTAALPLNTTKEEIVNTKLYVSNKEFKITAVSMGNPHCVVFLDGVANLDVNQLGAEFLKNPLFKEEVNVEFVEILSKNEVLMRVYERGSKETLACGTGACAVVSAMVKNGFCGVDDEVLVKLLGGNLEIRSCSEGVLMKGPAEKVFVGEVEV